MASDSLIGYVSGTLVDLTSSDSLIGYVTAAQLAPINDTDSLIGYASGSITQPHHPIGVWDGTEIIWGPITTWDGTNLT